MAKKPVKPKSIVPPKKHTMVAAEASDAKMPKMAGLMPKKKKKSDS